MPLVKQVLLLTLVAMSLGMAPGAAAEPADDPKDNPEDNPIVVIPTAVALPAAAGIDTVHTNLWLTEALMGEIVSAAVASLPPAPGAVRLVPLGPPPPVTATPDHRNDLFQAVAARVLTEAGYELYVTGEDPSRQGAVDYVFAYSVQTIKLKYPEVGRTLGLWQRWVARDLSVSVLVEVSAEDSGRLLLNERIVRRFGDRFDSDFLAEVDSDQYDFTSAETSSSGWQGRMEEIVVLGTLAGLVAIYFANTGE